MQSQKQSVFDVVTLIFKTLSKDMWPEACQPALWKANTTGALKETFLANGWSTDFLCHLQKRNNVLTTLFTNREELLFFKQSQIERIKSGNVGSLSTR